MATYIMLSTLTDEGRKTVKMRPERIKNPFHPTQKPVRVLEHIIEIASNKDDIVFDPFMGVGSTGVAALNLDRKFTGIEIDEKFFKASEKRLKAAASKLRLF